MSGIYIHGLSMPRKTGIVSIVLSGDGSALLCEDGAYSEIKAIPVPDHGDLIDRKALLKDKYAIFTIEEEGLWGMYRDKGVWLSAIKNAPTIIPADKEGE